MIIKDALVYTEEHTFNRGNVYINDGIIQGINYTEVMCESHEFPEDNDILKAHGNYLIPGLIDMHCHGCNGYDICDGTKEAIDEISRYEAFIGVTGIAPATMTLPVEELEKILTNLAEYESTANGADLLGVNMEGPFISRVRKGAQDERNIIPCDKDIYDRFQRAAKGLVKLIGIAPEEGDAISFINAVKSKVRVSLAHTNANYEEAKAAFDAGASHVVHLHNAMPPFLNREPGVIGAALDNDNVMAELICDGVHVHESVVRATFKLFGYERIVLISDSMRATGMADGIYTLGGLDVEVKGHRATLVSDGALAGSVATLTDCVRAAVKEMGIPLEAVIACATENPAKCLNVFDKYGSISVGKNANLVIMDKELDIVTVIKEGLRIS